MRELDTSLDAAWHPAANFEPRKHGQRPSILLLHYTGMDSADRALQWLCAPESRVSCHYFIDEAGRITQMVSEAMRAWHAGEASWAGETDINSASVGIETTIWEWRGLFGFPEAQMQAIEACRSTSRARNAYRAEGAGNSDVFLGEARTGERFDWGRLAGRAWQLGTSRTNRGGQVRTGDQGWKSSGCSGNSDKLSIAPTGLVSRGTATSSRLRGISAALVTAARSLATTRERVTGRCRGDVPAQLKHHALIPRRSIYSRRPASATGYSRRTSAVNIGYCD